YAEDQLVAVGEVAVHGGAGHLGRRGDVLDGGLHDAVALEARLGGVDEPGPSRAGVVGGVRAPAQLDHAGMVRRASVAMRHTPPRVVCNGTTGLRRRLVVLVDSDPAGDRAWLVV